MKFGLIQEKKFGTSAGAYSIVTNRENYDSQITLTDFEAAMVVSHFEKENIHVGNVKSNASLASKTFRLYPSGKTIHLNVVYPKAKKTELRLYISSEAGFKPHGGEIWFIFCKDAAIWIGAMDESNWRSELSELKQDESDEIYQRCVNDTDRIRIATLKARDTYVRDRNIAAKRMQLSGFTCEFDASHKLFISRFSNNPYLEVHHLVPIGLQRDFKKPLDTIHNIFCLCPFCHRAVHHAKESFAREILSNLALKRPILNTFNLSVTELLSLYAVEEID